MSAWLTIIGLNEDGPSAAAREALARAEVIFGGARHLALAQAGGRGRPWPVPFCIEPLLACRGMRVVALCSGDPFWFGAGSVLAQALPAEEWVALPAPSTFALAAAKLGWRLEETTCLGLHAAPFALARAHLQRGAKLICMLRDGASVPGFAAYLTDLGFGESRLWRLQALGGAREHITQASAAEMVGIAPGASPVAVAVEVAGALGLPRGAGLADALFAHDGQITKRPVRALTLSALAPRPGEHLWDIGLGSGSIAIEWLLAAPLSRASGVEADATRAARAMENAQAFGVAPRLHLLQRRAPDGLEGLARPDAIFIGGGASQALLERLWALAPAGTRLVANAVTLESEALLTAWSTAKGGSLLRLELAEAAPLGGKRGWVPARPIVQWSVTL